MFYFLECRKIMEAPFFISGEKVQIIHSIPFLETKLGSIQDFEHFQPVSKSPKESLFKKIEQASLSPDLPKCLIGQYRTFFSKSASSVVWRQLKVVLVFFFSFFFSFGTLLASCAFSINSWYAAYIRSLTSDS